VSGRNFVLDSRNAAAKERHTRIVDALLSDLRARARHETDLTTVVAREQASLARAQADLAALLDDLRVDAAWTGQSGLDWGEESRRLTDVFRTDPREGLTSWLQLVVASLLYDQRIPAELLDADLPSFTDVLVDRVRQLRVGLEERTWEDCGLLRRLADDEGLGEALAFGAAERGQLAALVARVALVSGRAEEVDRWLAKATDLGAPRGVVALIEAARDRRRGDHAAASAALQDARDGDAPAIELLVEEAWQAVAVGPADQIDTSSIDGEVWSLPSVAAAHDELARMIEPVLPEIWVAVARRHLADSDVKRATDALDRARRGVPDDHRPTTALNGTIGELNLALLEAGPAAPDELTTALVATASSFVDAGQHDRAIDLLDRALSLTPDHPPALVLEAESKRLRSIGAADADLAGQLGEVLANLDRVPLRAGQDDTTWALSVRAAAELTLSDRLDGETWRHRWQALDAASWAVAFGPTTAYRWGQLSQVAQELGLYRLAHLAGETWLRLVPGSADRSEATVNQAIVIANEGELRDAQEMIAVVDADGFVHRLIGAALGNVRGLVDLLAPRALSSAVALEPGEWYWLLLGQLALEEGRVPAFAELALERARRRPGSLVWRDAELVALLALGRWAEADERARALAEISAVARPDGASSHALAALAAHLAGRTDLAAFEHTIDLAMSAAEGGLWEHVLRPTLPRLATAAGRPVGDDALGRLDQRFAERMERLRRRTLDDELSDDSYDHACPELAAQVRSVARAVCDLRGGDLRRLLDAAAVGPHPGVTSPDDDTLLRDQANAAVKVLRSVGLVESLESCDAASVEQLVRDLLHTDSVDADVRLNSSRLAPARRAEVGVTLVGIAGEADDPDAASARFVLGYLGWPDFPAPSLSEPDEVGIDSTADDVIELPTSRFAGVGDPVHDDPLFVEVIPLLRRFRPLPSLTIQASDELEPDGYRILRLEVERERGVAPGDARWSDQGVAAIDIWPRREAGAPGSPWVAVEVGASDPLGELCTASTDEMVVRRLAQLDETSPSEPDPHAAGAPDAPVPGVLGRLDDLAGSVRGWWQRVRPQA